MFSKFSTMNMFYFNLEKGNRHISKQKSKAFKSLRVKVKGNLNQDWIVSE